MQEYPILNTSLHSYIISLEPESFIFTVSDIEDFFLPTFSVNRMILQDN